MTEDASVGRWDDDRLVVLAVAIVTAASLAARLVALGERVFHWDEARVGYWILRYQETGHWEYRAIVHGPFLPQVNRLLFELFGASDFLARVPVAAIGGLLPLAALLFRHRLRDVETVALAGLLAANPVLVYYSRFMRNDVLLASLMVFALGFLLRAYDDGGRRHLYAGVLALALAFTTKENVIVYLGTWVGAFALVIDHRLFLARAGDDGTEGWYATVRTRGAGAARGLWAWRYALLLAVFEFFVVIVVFYAPRPAFGEAVASPGRLPGVVEAATVGAAETFYGTWIGGGLQGHAYLPYLEHYLGVLYAGGLVITVLSVAGFLLDRYAGDRPRDLVGFAFYWGAASVFIYPLISDIQAPWTATHAIVPLAFPAAVALGAVVRWGYRGVAADNTAAIAVAAVVVLVAGGGMVAATVDVAYLHPQDESPLIQFGQPGSETLRADLQEAAAVTRGNDGPDVLFYGDHFYVPDESDALEAPMTSGKWHQRLPLSWYLELFDMEPTSTTHIDDVDGNGPPVVIALDDSRANLADRLPGYRASVHEITLPNTETVVFVDDEPENNTRS